MKKINLIVCFVLISFFVAAQSAELVYKNNVNSTVTIETEIGQGSGFFVGPNLIATNFHVIEGATEAFCYTNSSAAKYEIEGYVALDKEVDLVILKVLASVLPIRISTIGCLVPSGNIISVKTLRKVISLELYWPLMVVLLRMMDCLGKRNYMPGAILLARLSVN